jgi:hypothetical protein
MATWEQHPEHLNVLVHYDSIGGFQSPRQRVVRVRVRYCSSPLPSDEFDFSSEAPIGRVTEIRVEPETVWRNDAVNQLGKQGAVCLEWDAAAVRRAVEALQDAWSGIHGGRLAVQDNTGLLSSAA